MKKTLSLILLLIVAAPAKKFYSDDPLAAEPPHMNIADPKNRKLSDYFDLFLHQFGKPGERQPEKGPPIRAKGVNTLGEPIDSAWWEPRHYYKPMTIDELKRGFGSAGPPSLDGKWTVISAKNEGITPGFTILDSQNRRYFVKFDPLSNPEMATSVDAIVSRIFYALGYHVPENDIIYFTPDQLVIREGVTVSDKTGQPTKMTRGSLTELLLKVPKTKEGKYRATASLALPGKPVGPPRYFGTRADDPNDVVPHEHRRDLRGLHVLCAWLGHDDSRAINNLDVIYKQDGAQYLMHFLLDFGSTLGSGTEVANSARSGAYFFSWKASAQQLFTLGLFPQYWAFADFPNLPSTGRFEWKVFDPERWRPDYPNPAFQNRLPDDDFWGAKLVTAFTDEQIRALVETGEYSDPRAAAWVVECLIERRNKVGKTYFAKVLPFDRFNVDNGQLIWEDLGAKLGYTPAAAVSTQWYVFDNETEKKTPLGGQTSPTLPLLNGRPFDGYYGATITNTKNPKQTIDVYLRGGKIVGIDRTW